ncbi:hypothetical protein MXB_3191, partial [Myxobolus squamalis]
MDVINCVRNYFKRILKIVGTGIKALILDRETISIISLVFPQSELHKQEIYLFERIDSMSTDQLLFVKAIFVLRPTKASGWYYDSLMRCSESIYGLLLSLKIIPHIRFQKSSKLSYELGNDVLTKLQLSNLSFDSLKSDQKSLLLILERKFDPLTPLLLKWSYQSMIHESFYIKNNIVNLASIPNVPPDFNEIILSPETDGIFRNNMYLNFSELASNIKGMATVDSFPKFRKVSNYISLHVTIASELNNIAKIRKHRELSEFEQNVVNDFEMSKASIDVIFKISNAYILIELIRDSSVTAHDATRLAMIYLISRTKIKENDKERIFKELKGKQINVEQFQAVEHIIKYCNDPPGTVKFLQEKYPGISATKKYLKNILQVEETEVQYKPSIEH